MSTHSIHAFAEKVAVISDGADPVGRAVALQLALLGCYVIVGYSEASGESRRALEELQSLGTLASAVEADVSTAAGARRLIEEAGSRFGRIDLLVNSLKLADDSPFESLTEGLWQELVDRNLKSVVFVTQSAIPLMKERPKPRIVNVAARVAGGALFGALQQAVISFTGSLATDLPANFRVNCVAVGGGRRKVREGLDPELFPPTKGVEADDAARAIVFLLSSEAVGVNGQTVNVD